MSKQMYTGEVRTVGESMARSTTEAHAFKIFMDEPVELDGALVKLEGSGRALPVGKPRHASADRREVVVPLPALSVSPPPGSRPAGHWPGSSARTSRPDRAPPARQRSV